jgi:hypothetical protein
MSGRFRVKASAVSAAPIDAVWARPADASTWVMQLALARFLPVTAPRLAAAAEAVS